MGTTSNLQRFTFKVTGNGYVVVDNVKRMAFAENQNALRSPAYFRHSKIEAKFISILKKSSLVPVSEEQIGGVGIIQNNDELFSLAVNNSTVLIEVYKDVHRPTIVITTRKERDTSELYSNYAYAALGTEQNDALVIYVHDPKLVIDMKPIMDKVKEIIQEDLTPTPGWEPTVIYDDLHIEDLDHVHIPQLDLFCETDEVMCYGYRLEMLVESIKRFDYTVKGDMASGGDIDAVMNGEGYQYRVVNTIGKIAVFTVGSTDRIDYPSIIEHLNTLPIHGSDVVFVHVNESDFTKLESANCNEEELVINTVRRVNWGDLDAKDGENFYHAGIDHPNCYAEYGCLLKPKVIDNADKYKLSEEQLGVFRLVKAEITGKTVWAIRLNEHGSVPLFILPIDGITIESMREVVFVLANAVELVENDHFVMISVDNASGLYQSIYDNIPKTEKLMSQNEYISEWYNDLDKFGFSTLADGGSFKVDHLFHVKCAVDDETKKSPYHSLKRFLGETEGNRYSYFGAIQYTGLDVSICGEMVFASSISDGKIVLYVATLKSDTELYNAITVEEVVDYLRANGVFTVDGEEPIEFVIGFSLDPNWSIFHNFHRMVFGHAYKQPDSWVQLLQGGDVVIEKLDEVVEPKVIEEVPVEEVVETAVPEKKDIFDGVFSGEEAESEETQVSGSLVADGYFYLLNFTGTQITSSLPVCDPRTECPDDAICVGYIVDFADYEADMEVIERAKDLMRPVYQVIHKSQVPTLKRIM